MKQEYVSKSACKGCEHLEHDEGALLSESEYACKASVLDTVPAGCDTFGTKPAVRTLTLEITSCNQCPHSFEYEAHGYIACTKTSTRLCGNTLKELARLAIPDSCPLEVQP